MASGTRVDLNESSGIANFLNRCLVSLAWMASMCATPMHPVSLKAVHRLLLFGIVAFAATGIAQAQPKPVPRMQAIPLPHEEVSFQCAGRELTRFHFKGAQERPFLFPVNGPSGISLTRMGHPHDPVSHSHHNSVWISHALVNGRTFWADTSGDRIVHQRVEKLVDGDEAASVETSAIWRTKEGADLLSERLKTSVEPLDEGEWLLVVDLSLSALKETVTFGETAFGMMAVRVAKTMGVKDGGGTIRNSEGGVDEAGCFRKRARWVDYSGPVTSDAQEGVTLFDHPSNFGYPAHFHVRDDGWMGAALTFGGSLTLEPGQMTRLRYGLYVHRGVPDPSVLEGRWRAFSGRPPQ